MMMLSRFSPLAVAMFIAVSVQAAFAFPEVPGATQQTPVALVGGTIHPVSGPAIASGTLVFAAGKIVAVGASDDVAVPKDAIKLDAKGKHIYPGLFDGLSNIGLVEINAVRATRDYQESGRINPNVKANVSVNPDSELIPVTRSNGVLLALTAPNGGLISGRSSVLQLDGWTFEDLTLKADVGLHIEWPRMLPAMDWDEKKSPDQQRKDRDESLDRLRKVFDNARAYQKARSAKNGQQVDLRLEAMLPVLDRELPIIVMANEVQQIQAAIAFASKQNVKLIIAGGYDAVLCAPLLKKHSVPVIVTGTYRLPRRRADDYDAPYTLPDRLRAAGIPFCIAGTGRFGASNVRNLPYHAATAVAFGLPPEEALKAITLYPAQVFGVADRVGSLEAGKDATLFIADGDPLETATQIERAYVGGREIDLSDRHKRLWKKYEEKYRRQRKAADNQK